MQAPIVPMHTHYLPRDRDWSPRPLLPTYPLDYGVSGMETALRWSAAVIWPDIVISRLQVIDGTSLPGQKNGRILYHLLHAPGIHGLTRGRGLK